MRILSFVLLFATTGLFGQSSLDLFTLSYRYGPPQPYEDGTGEATETGILSNLKLPIVFNEKTIWYSELTYQSFNVDYSNEIAGEIMPIGLHGFILQTGLVQRISDRNAFQLLVVPRLMSDFNNVDVSHWQLGGIALYEIKYSDKLMMRYGLMYNRERFGNMFVPLINIDWRIGSKWSVTGLLPIFGKINYQASEKLILGLSHFGLITSFQVGDPSFNLDYIERKSIDLALFGRYNFVGNLWFESRIGFAVGRSYLQFADGDEMDFRVAIATFGDDRVQKNTAFDPGPILDLRLVYNLDLTDR